MLKPRVLVIDADASARRLLTRTLSTQFTLECVDDVDAACAALDVDASYDAVLCELQVPGMSSAELEIQLLRRSTALAERLVITGSANPFRHETLVPSHVTPMRPRSLSLDEIRDALWRAIGPRASLPPPANAALAA